MHQSSQNQTAACPAIGETRLGCVPRSKRRVLFVNADSDLRQVVTRVLERENYEVRAVVHSGHAVLLARSGQFDVLVTELSSPDISGPALLEQLRRHCPSLIALYFSNPGTSEGVDQVLVRPFTRDDLLSRLEFVLSSEAAPQTIEGSASLGALLDNAALTRGRP